MKVIGHRGAKGLAPENTAASIKKALECGVNEVEIDVRTTKDNQLVLCHNKFIRADGRTKLTVKSHTLTELRAQKPDIATLEEAILAVNKTVPLDIEVKSGTDLQPIIATLKKFLSEGWQAENFLFASFDFKILQQLHKEFPQIGLIVNEHYFGTRATFRARRLGARRLCMNKNVLWFGFIRAVRRNFELYAYTVNDPKKAQRWAKSGLAGVVTDFPDRFN